MSLQTSESYYETKVYMLHILQVKEVPLLQEASWLEQCLGKPGRMPVLAPAETEIQSLTAERRIL